VIVVDLDQARRRRNDGYMVVSHIPRSGLRHPVLAMADRSIDPTLGLTHACPSVRRRLA